ncbi:MAG: hypothetical protein V4712_13290 [Pseudomonadota bacterium]
MIRHLTAVLDLFRLPIIDEIERDYVKGAATPVEAKARQSAVARGLFRRGTFDY